jgi:hypothetical protein
VSERKDSVEMQGGITHLPAEFREVARLANRAGLDGYEVVDVEWGVDLDEALKAIAEISPLDDVYLGREMPWPKSRILITYAQMEKGQ